MRTVNTKFNTPDTYEKQFTYKEDDWRGWSEITEEEIKIAEANGIDRNLLYQRLEIMFMPLSVAIKQKPRIKQSKNFSREQLQRVYDAKVSRMKIYDQMRLNKLTFEEAFERVCYLYKYRHHYELAMENGVKPMTFYKRVYAGWDLEKASCKTVQTKTNSQQREKMKELKISTRTIYYHLNQGKTFDEAVQYVLNKRG